MNPAESLAKVTSAMGDSVLLTRDATWCRATSIINYGTLARGGRGRL